MNREVERAARSPHLADLRDSGEIEQEADIVLFLHKSDLGHEIHVGKNRYGPCQRISVSLSEDTRRFEYRL